MLEKISVILLTYLGFFAGMFIYKTAKEEIMFFKKKLWVVKLMVVVITLTIFLFITKHIIYLSLIYLLIVVVAEYLNFDYISYLTFSLLFALSTSILFIFASSFLFVYNTVNLFIFKVYKKNVFINIAVRIYYLPLSILFLILLSNF